MMENGVISVGNNVALSVKLVPETVAKTPQHAWWVVRIVIYPRRETTLI